MAQGPGYHEIANTGQIMQGIVQPAAGAINTASKDAGPTDGRAWRQVVINSVLLQESAQLLKTSGRAKDQDGWVKAADTLGEVGADIQKAAAAQDLAGLQAAAAKINPACQGCHSVYRVRPGQRKQ
jgi:cytochrome c556